MVKGSRFIETLLSKGKKRSAAWTVMEEEDVDMNGSLMRFRKLCWAMLSMVRVPDLVEKGVGGRKTTEDGGGEADCEDLFAVLEPLVSRLSIRH